MMMVMMMTLVMMLIDIDNKNVDDYDDDIMSLV